MNTIDYKTTFYCQKCKSVWLQQYPDCFVCETNKYTKEPEDFVCSTCQHNWGKGSICYHCNPELTVLYFPSKEYLMKNKYFGPLYKTLQNFWKTQPQPRRNLSQPRRNLSNITRDVRGRT